MPTNKNAQLRYRVLDKCFRTRGAKYSFKDLLRIVNDAMAKDDQVSAGVSERQLRDDIKHMRDPETGFGAQILTTSRDHDKPYYTYEDKTYSIYKSELSDKETSLLKSAISMLSKFEGAPQFEWLSEVLPTLSDRFNLEGSNSKKVIGFDSNTDYEGNEYIPSLFDAISNKNVLIVEYEPYNRDPFEVEFHPHYIKQYNNRWFVFGLNANAPEGLEHIADIWNMPLDRIKGFKVTSKAYIPSHVNWEEDYFSEIIGVSRNEGIPEEVRLWFNADQAPYIITKPLHRSQRLPIFQEDGSVIIKMYVVPNYELEQLILSFGEKAMVLSPKSLRDNIYSRLRLSLEKYK